MKFYIYIYIYTQPTTAQAFPPKFTILSIIYYFISIIAVYALTNFTYKDISDFKKLLFLLCLERVNDNQYHCISDKIQSCTTYSFLIFLFQI